MRPTNARAHLKTISMSLSGMRNYQKRPSGVKRDLFTRKRALLTLANLRTVSMSLSISIMALLSLLCDSSSANDSCRCGMQEVSKEACSCGKSGLLYIRKRDLPIWRKDPHIFGKREYRHLEKRPAYMAKETYSCGKRDLPICQKIPAYMAKETCLFGKEAY